MLIFLLFAVINLSVGFAAAVLLGYGPHPWYALFLPSKRDNVIQIDAIDAEEETGAEESAPTDPPAEKGPEVVSQPFPEMNEPEDLPAEPEPVAQTDPVAQAELEAEQPTEPVAEKAEEPAAAVPSAAEEDNELEEYLAGRKEEPKDVDEQEPAGEKAAEIASADDIESMFAATQTSEEESPPEDPDTKPDSTEEDESEEATLDQDDIAALFQ